MPWCQNNRCRKENLKKEDIEFDEELRMVLCTGCYALRHPGWMPTETMPSLPAPPGDPRLTYEVRLTSDRGLAAKVSFGDLTLSFAAPMEEIQRYLGGS